MLDLAGTEAFGIRRGGINPRRAMYISNMRLAGLGAKMPAREKE
jgi:hypothetical protein